MFGSILRILTLGCALCVGVVRAETVLTLAHGAAEDNPRHVAALRFAELVTKASKGRIEVRVSPASRAGDDGAVLDKVAKHEIDITANSQGAVSKIVPEYAALGLPYIFSSQVEVWRVLSGKVGQALAQKSESQGLVVLGFWDNGFRQMTNSKRPIRVPEDLRGLTIRTPADPATVDFVTALGATAKTVPFSQLPQAARDGVVDGQENPLINIYTARLHEVQKYLTLTNHKYETTPFLMSKASWDRLNAQDQKLMRAAADDATRLQRDLMMKADERLFGRLSREGITINHAGRDLFVAASQPVIDKWASGPTGEFTGLLLKSIDGFRKPGARDK